MNEYHNYEDQPQGQDPYQNPYQQPQAEYHMPNYAPQTPKKKNGGTGKVIALALCFSLVGSALGAGGVLLAQNRMGRPSGSTAILEGQRELSTIETVKVGTGTRMTPAEVYAANVASTVGITTSITTNYWGFQTTSAASGSGFIISADGYILTNHHVIENSSTITVAMHDGSTYDAKLIGYDESNDIAVLKIEAENLTPVVLGNSDGLNVGEEVVAIGNPLGELTFSLTAGYVSAMDRQVTFSGGRSMKLIQTDAAINSGNSGGALFNLYGEVVGVTNAKYSSSSSGASIDNIGFAIPINSVRAIVESIIEKGYIAKPYIGISVGNVGQEAQMYGLPKGGAIMDVTEDGPADKAGLQAGDIVTKANGQDIASGDDLVQAVRALSAGDSLNLTVYRQGQELEITVTVDEQIQSALEEQVQNQSMTQQGNIQGFPWSFMR